MKRELLAAACLVVSGCIAIVVASHCFAYKLTPSPIAPRLIVPSATTTYSEIFTSSTPAKVVFFFPHQDDEMFMTGAILAALSSHKSVYAIMVTDGGASAVRGSLKPYHLSRQAFSAARNREWYNSMIALGVDPQHILFANDGGVTGTSSPEYLDGELSIPLATRVIQHFYKQIGNGTYCTVAAELGSINSQHGDHSMLRSALVDFPGIRQKLFFSEKQGIGTAIKLTDSEQKKSFAALNSYFHWDPADGEFAIAHHSVPELLNFWRTSPLEYLLTSIAFAEPTSTLPKIK